MSPVRYYKTLRLEKARLLLTQSSMPVLNVAVACGFISSSHFSKSYRSANRVSPIEARIARSKLDNTDKGLL